jgi:hypothetical protein
MDIKPTEKKRSLEERMKAYPRLSERMGELIDEMERDLVSGGTLDDTEERLIPIVRQLGVEVITARAETIMRELSAPSGLYVHRHSQKKVRWLSTFGWIEVWEQLWQVDGMRVRPFCEHAGVSCGGNSLRVQRALTDFGADEAFATAAQKFKEHYGVEISVYRVKQTTYKHARGLIASTPPPNRALPAKGAKAILAEADGCMMPVVSFASAPPGADRRKYRKVEYKEVRLVAARDVDSAQTHYAATMDGVEVAGDLWESVARDAGRGLYTHVHGLGDGALWVAGQCMERFAPYVRYTVDLYHVCDYLTAVWPEQREMVCRHRDHLKAGEVDKVLAALRAIAEPAELPEEKAPARKALRYLENRLSQLDYLAALAAGLPIGSGLIESGNRHVLQRRLKQAGAWWLSENLNAMAYLRSHRASGTYDSYWSRN